MNFLWPESVKNQGRFEPMKTVQISQWCNGKTSHLFMRSIIKKSHPKMKILSFIQLFQTFISFVEKKKDILKNVGYQTFDGSHWLPFCGEKIYYGSQWVPSTATSNLQNIIFSMEESNSYRFGTSRKWVNYDRIFIFRWTITLNVVQYLS